MSPDGRRTSVDIADDYDMPARSCHHDQVRPGWLTAADRRELRAWFALDGLVASWDDGPCKKVGWGG